MPVNFLTEEQRARYGRFNQIPDEPQLAGFFHLDVSARREVMGCRGARAQLGYAIQLGTVRFLGTFLTDPTAVPAAVIDYVASQLGIVGEELKGYSESEDRWIRYLAGGGSPTPIGRALMELGRLDRSAFLASYFDSELLRRRINTQLNRQESRHQFARKIFHGQRGELRQKYREGQEDQLSALGFVLNCCILWNTVYTTRALNEIRAEGTCVAAADIARLSPLGFDHLNFLGRYSFALPDYLRDGDQLRPLRKPGLTL